MLQHEQGAVDPGDLVAAPRQREGMLSRPAPDIQDTAGAGSAMARQQPLDQVRFALVVLGAIDRVIDSRIVAPEDRAHEVDLGVRPSRTSDAVMPLIRVLSASPT